uniref:Uncharacterized protein n=1 Tax=Cuerna arida TaxID=1464854 RepID=A0A1B6F8R3_9HEMI
MRKSNRLSQLKISALVFLLSFLYCFTLCSVQNYDGFIGAFYSLEDVLEVFNKEKYRENPSVIKLLRMYNALVEDVGNVSLYDNNNPFIAIEGNHKTRRFIVARQLARALKATNLRSPPEFMNFLKFDFKELEIRRAYYSLALYANALEARRLLHEKAVVTAGYWLDIAAFSLAKKYPIAFPENSSEMRWPEDLLAPDIVFYINSPPPETTLQYNMASTKPPNPLKPRLVDVYRSWTYPRVVELSGYIFSYNEMFTEMFRHINFIKQSKFKQYLKQNRKTLKRSYTK